MRTSTITSVLAAVALIVPASSAAQGAGNLANASRPAWQAIVQPGSTRQVPAAVCHGKSPSDVQAARMDGSYFRQGHKEYYGLTARDWQIPFFGRAGLAVAGYVHLNRDWYNFNRRTPIRVAVWCG